MKTKTIKLFEKLKKEFYSIKYGKIKLTKMKSFIFFKFFQSLTFPFLALLLPLICLFIINGLSFNELDKFYGLYFLLVFITYPVSMILSYFFNCIFTYGIFNKIKKELTKKENFVIKDYIFHRIEVEESDFSEIKNILRFEHVSFLDVFKHYFRNLNDKDFIENDKELFLLFKNEENINLSTYDTFFLNKYSKLLKNETINLDTLKNRIDFYSNELKNDKDRKSIFLSSFNDILKKYKDEKEMNDVYQTINSIEKNENKKIYF